ncbi:AzlD domain-containing protein [Alicyclobacillus sp. ALC3]|uniref:AzlD domain-containing protein n=1 Tax=Alicyclobacillus sp. ALC3 TaxID=2796143 RepID=UPI00237859C2|nr:AzlD domain-containing protein [Alicyclobacillus sp. ALC3]WDL95593.1 AzlD domain-containing protein [Alicyclobacillus sp. ALC3]
MSTSAFSVLVLCAAVVTYLTRWPPLLLGRKLRLPARVERTFPYIPIGVFAAMVAPAIVWHAPVAGHIDTPFYVAAAVSLAAAFVTRKPLWAMLTGVLTIALWHLVH